LPSTHIISGWQQRHVKLFFLCILKVKGGTLLLFT